MRREGKVQLESAPSAVASTGHSSQLVNNPPQVPGPLAAEEPRVGTLRVIREPGLHLY